jgi:hypothetical protein
MIFRPRWEEEVVNTACSLWERKKQNKNSARESGGRESACFLRKADQKVGLARRVGERFS